MKFDAVIVIGLLLISPLSCHVLASSRQAQLPARDVPAEPPVG